MCLRVAGDMAAIAMAVAVSGDATLNTGSVALARLELGAVIRHLAIPVASVVVVVAVIQCGTVVLASAL